MAAEPVAVPQENTPDPMLPLYKQFDELTELWRVQTEAQAVALEIVTNVLSGADPEGKSNLFNTHNDCSYVF